MSQSPQDPGHGSIPPSTAIPEHVGAIGAYEPASLAKNTVGLAGAVAQSAAFIAPAVGLTAGNIFIAGLVGVAAPFEFVIGMLICLCIASVIGQYTKQISHAGSFYAYLTRAFGPKTGFVAGILQFGAYLCLLTFTFAFFGSFVDSYLTSHGLNLPWQIYTLALGLLCLGIVTAGISPSLKFTLAALSIEIAIFTLLSLIILIKGGANGWSAAPFNPANSTTGFSGIVLGSVFTIFAFVGFESATSLSEEARNPTRTIPLAVMLTTIVVGSFYVFATYAEVIGFGTNAEGIKALQTNASPFTSLASTYVGGWLSVLVELATISSLAALGIAQVQAGSRVFFAMGRDGFFPRRLATVDKRGTPVIAISAVAAFGFLVTIIGGSAWGAESFSSWAAYLGTLLFVGAYALLLIGIVRYAQMHPATDFHLIRHLAIPIVGLIGIGVVLYGNVHPVPPRPLNYLIWVAVAVAIIAVALVDTLEKRRPSKILEAGAVLGTMEH